MLLGGLAYIGVTQLYKEGVVQAAKVRAESIGGKILNVGATGLGNIISSTATIDGSVGCDISPEGDMDYCDISTQMPYADKEYDVVFASHVIEHVKPYEVIRALSEFQRIGKKVVVVVPPPFMLAYYLAPQHQSQIRKKGNTLNIRNNPLYNPVYENYTIEYDPDVVEVFQ